MTGGIYAALLDWLPPSIPSKTVQSPLDPPDVECVGAASRRGMYGSAKVGSVDLLRPFLEAWGRLCEEP
eukprot:2332931-Rhodomonas_salina.12